MKPSCLLEPLRAAVLISALSPALLAVGTASASAAPASHHTEVISNCRTATAEPERVIIACGDYDEYLTVRHYDSWTDDAASGRGHLHVDDCRPNCAAGTFHRYPATVRFREPVTTPTGLRLFRILSIHYLKHGVEQHARVLLIVRPHP